MACLECQKTKIIHYYSKNNSSATDLHTEIISELVIRVIFQLGSHTELRDLVGVVLLKMAGLELTLRLKRAWLEALHRMNSYVETRAPEELDHLIYVA